MKNLSNEIKNSENRVTKRIKIVEADIKQVMKEVEYLKGRIDQIQPLGTNKEAA